eukprot:Awhi_evm2s14618
MTAILEEERRFLPSQDSKYLRGTNVPNNGDKILQYTTFTEFSSDIQDNLFDGATESAPDEASAAVGKTVDFCKSESLENSELVQYKNFSRKMKQKHNSPITIKNYLENRVQPTLPPQNQKLSRAQPKIPSLSITSIDLLTEVDIFKKTIINQSDELPSELLSEFDVYEECSQVLSPSSGQLSQQCRQKTGSLHAESLDVLTAIGTNNDKALVNKIPNNIEDINCEGKLSVSSLDILPRPRNQKLSLTSLINSPRQRRSPKFSVDLELLPRQIQIYENDLNILDLVNSTLDSFKFSELYREWWKAAYLSTGEDIIDDILRDCEEQIPQTTHRRYSQPCDSEFFDHKFNNSDLRPNMSSGSSCSAPCGKRSISDLNIFFGIKSRSNTKKARSSLDWRRKGKK